jgi:uncharacterized membrane protein
MWGYQYFLQSLPGGLDGALNIDPIFGIIGIVFVLIGMKGLAEHYKDDKIYKKTHISAIFGIISSILFVVPITLFLNLYGLYPSSATYWPYFIVLPALITVLVCLFMMLMMLTFRKALNTIANHSSNTLFRTTGKILFIGTTLSFAFCISSIISTMLMIGSRIWAIPYLWAQLGGSWLFLAYIAFLVLAIAVFSLKESPNTHHTTTVQC